MFFTFSPFALRKIKRYINPAPGAKIVQIFAEHQSRAGSCSSASSRALYLCSWHITTKREEYCALNDVILFFSTLKIQQQQTHKHTEPSSQ